MTTPPFEPKLTLALPSVAALLVVAVSACGTSPGDGGASSQQGTQAVAAGQIFNFGALAHPGSCMDAQASGTGDGTQIQEWTCNGSGAQSYELVDAGGGAFAIVNTNANKCVDVQARGTANGTKIQLWDCNQTPAQSFLVQDAGNGFVHFVNTNSGKCLDVAADSPADGTRVQLYDCNGTSAQTWNPTVIGTTSSGGGGSSSGGSTGGLATCNASQLAHCNCPGTFSCCPTDGSCFQTADQVVYTMCKNDPASACSMSGASGGSSGGGGSSGAGSSGGSSSGSTPPPPPPPNGQHAVQFQNHCGYDIWVGGEGNPVNPPVHCNQGCPSGSVCNPANQLCTYQVPDASWHMTPGQSMSLDLPASWGGRFWPRTGCTTQGAQTICATGDCGGNLACPVGVGGAPPATLAEFTVEPPSTSSDFYDVSNVDGANVPVAIAPIPGTFNPTPPPGANVPYYCASPGCTGNCGALPACSWNLDATCPAELQDKDPGHYVGCRSAGQVCAVDPGNAALNCGGEVDLYRCNPGGPNGVSGSCYSQGANASCCGCPSWSPAGACQSSNPAWTGGPAGKYAGYFKGICPTAYSFPYDDLTSTFTCNGSSTSNTGYTITFCP